MKIKVLFMFIILSGLVSSCYSQRGFADLDTLDGIRVQYSWQKESPLKKESDAALNLRLTNLNDYPANVTLTLLFLDDRTSMQESNPVTVCLRPGQSLRGGLSGLLFASEGLTLERAKSDAFSWEIEVFDVEQVEACPN